MKHLFGFIFLFIICWSCKKDGDTPLTTCRVETAVFNYGQDTVRYSYSNGLFTKLSFPAGYYFTFDYNNGRPVRRNFFVGPAIVPSEHHDFVYNSNGTLARVEFYELVNAQNNQYTMYGKIIFTYYGDQLVELGVYSVANNTDTLEEKYSYTSISGNINTCHAIDYLPSVQVADFSYICDNSLNFFNKQNPYSFLVNPAFIDMNPVLLPMTISKNNVTNISVGGANNSVRYVLNDKQDLYYFSINETNGVSYIYKCE